MASARRDVIKLRLDPAGPEEPGAVKTFKLIKITEHQIQVRKDGRWTAPDLDDREVLADGLTRRQVAELAQDAVDWLSYVEGGG